MESKAIAGEKIKWNKLKNQTLQNQGITQKSRNYTNQIKQYKKRQKQGKYKNNE